MQVSYAVKVPIFQMEPSQKLKATLNTGTSVEYIPNQLSTFLFILALIIITCGFEFLKLFQICHIHIIHMWSIGTNALLETKPVG